MVPCEIQLPYLPGREDDLNKMTGLSENVGAMEEMREER